MPSEKLVFDFSTAKTLCLKINGDWQVSAGFPSLKEITSQLEIHRDTQRLNLDLSESFLWDSGFISFLVALSKECKRRKIDFSYDALPDGMQKLVSLALSALERSGGRRQPAAEPFLEEIGDRVIKLEEETLSLMDFLGELAVAFFRFCAGKAYFRREDFILIVQRCGVNALGLVSLISLLVGMILAFIGAIQLRIFGAQTYIADIVGIAMVRVMGAVMTGVLVAGRTGASFAAELGIMQANEEIDAFKTLGVNPAEFLVLPRVLALVIMMPLLTLYADLMGIAGGFIVSTVMMGINPMEYLDHTQAAVKLSNLWIGLTHGLVFGVIIAVCGCLRGMNCERSAEGVGVATTSAVVSAITNIVIATAIITYICQILGI